MLRRFLARDDESIALNIDTDILLRHSGELDGRGDDVRLGRLVDVHLWLESCERALLLAGTSGLVGWTLGEGIVDESVEVVEGEEWFVELERHCVCARSRVVKAVERRGKLEKLRCYC